MLGYISTQEYTTQKTTKNTIEPNGDVLLSTTAKTHAQASFRSHALRAIIAACSTLRG